MPGCSRSCACARPRSRLAPCSPRPRRRRRPCPLRWAARNARPRRPARLSPSRPAGRERSSSASHARPLSSTRAAPSPRTAGASTAPRRRPTPPSCSSPRPPASPRASGSGRSVTRRTAAPARWWRLLVVGPGATRLFRPRRARLRSPRSRRRREGCRSSPTPSIPSRIGASNHARLVLALSEGSPAVSRSRLIALVRNSAHRWRLDARGPVKRVPRVGDGHDDVGFSAALVSDGALGTTTLLRQNYVRVRRVCAAAGCRTARTPVGTRVVERDLALLPDVPWAPGPAHPTSDEYDLETVGPARARPLGGQPAPHAGRLPRHTDGQGPRPRPVVALA